jgi:hypothetical protein
MGSGREKRAERNERIKVAAQVHEANSDGWQKGFTNVTPGAPHYLAAGK